MKSGTMYALFGAVIALGIVNLALLRTSATQGQMDAANTRLAQIQQDMTSTLAAATLAPSDDEKDEEPAKQATLMVACCDALSVVVGTDNGGNAVAWRCKDKASEAEFLPLPEGTVSVTEPVVNTTGTAAYAAATFGSEADAKKVVLYWNTDAESPTCTTFGVGDKPEAGTPAAPYFALLKGIKSRRPVEMGDAGVTIKFGKNGSTPITWALPAE